MVQGEGWVPMSRQDGEENIGGPRAGNRYARIMVTRAELTAMSERGNMRRMNTRNNLRAMKALFAKSRYVVMKSTADRSVVAHGNELDSVLDKADKGREMKPYEELVNRRHSPDFALSFAPANL